MSDFWMIVNFTVNSVAILFVALMVIDIISFYIKAFVSFLLSYDFFARWKIRIELKIVIWKFLIKEKLKEWWEWWENLSGLKRVYFLLAIFAVVLLGYSLYSIFPKFIQEIAEMRASFGDLALAVFASLSGLGAVFGFYTSIARTETQEQGLITDRINKATEGLGKNNEKGDAVVEVRLGALFALERIAQDSIRDHISIMEILCTYIHTNSPRDSNADKSKKPEPLREDIQAALTIIGRREKWVGGKKRIRKERRKGYHLDLRHCNLRAAELNEANLDYARLNNADLFFAQFHKATLIHANLNFTDIRYTYFRDAFLRYATLVEADFSVASFSGADMRCANIERAIPDRAWFYKADMKGVHAMSFDFSKIRYISQEQLNQMFCGGGVNIKSEFLKLERPKHWSEHSLSNLDFEKEYQEWLKKADLLLLNPYDFYTHDQKYPLPPPQ